MGAQKFARNARRVAGSVVAKTSPSWVTGDADDLTRIVDVRLIELRAVLLVLVDAIDHVAEMEEEGGRSLGMGSVVIGGHGFSNDSLWGVGAAASVSAGVEPDGAGGLNLLGARLTDDVSEGEERRAGGRRNWFEVALDVIQQTVADTRHIRTLSDRRGCKERVGKAERLRGLSPGRFFWLGKRGSALSKPVSPVRLAVLPQTSLRRWISSS